MRFQFCVYIMVSLILRMLDFFFKDEEEITDEDINGLIGLRFDLPYDYSVYTMIVLSLDDDKVRGLLG